MVYGFKMKLRSGCEAEYKKRHDNLWPEMKELIHENGGSNYSIFWSSILTTGRFPKCLK